jgi:hypothetical protein
MNAFTFLILISIVEFKNLNLFECKPQASLHNIIEIVDEEKYFEGKVFNKPNLILISFDGIYFKIRFFK